MRAMRADQLPLVLFFTSSALYNLAGCAGPPPPLTPIPTEDKTVNDTPLAPEIERQIWRVRGQDIIDGAGEPVTMRGIAFGNEVWSHTPIPSAHHSGDDFAVVASMGMNVVRFYLSYHTFEDDGEPFQYKDSGFAWVDQNVEWARKHGIRLILNMHDPVGGYQSLGKGTGLWTDDNNQRRFIELWRAIAERYRAEPTIAGFDILNEPIPTESIEQWTDLASRTVASIRDVNQHHMIFVERANAIGGDWAENTDRNFFKVDDPNVVYEFHFYKPYHFTHQNAEWSDFAAREGWYPDENSPEVDWFQLETVATTESEPLPVGSSDWTLLETKPYVVDDPNIVVGKPFLVCDQAGGKASFDSLSLVRVDGAKGLGIKKGGDSPVKKMDPFELPEPTTQFELDLDTRRGWYFWEEEPAGRAYFDLSGHGDSTALSIDRTTGPANLGSDPLRFFTQQGSEYNLNALARGEGLSPRARCLIRLEFYSSKVPVLPRGKNYLEQELNAYLNWGKRNEVPLLLGEFGTIRDSFLPGRGGLLWVEDMLELLTKHHVHFTYHAYHERPFGLFLGGTDLPSRHGLYLPLYELFVDQLGGNGRLPWADEDRPSLSRNDADSDANQ